MSAIQRKMSFPQPRKSIDHDFRKEFRGSALEKKLRGKSRWDSWMKSLFDWKKPTTSTPKGAIEGKMMTLPNEMLLQIMEHLDSPSLLNLRSVNGRLKCVVDDSRNQKKFFSRKVVDRLVISSGPRRSGYLLRCISYDTQSSKVFSISSSQLKKRRFLRFGFSHLDVQMICFKDLHSGQFNDDLVFWLCDHLAFSQSAPNHLSMDNVDFRGSGELTLHHILAFIGKNLSVFEMDSLCGVTPNSVTDAHLSQLDPTKIRRIVCDNVTMAKKKDVLRLGTATLQKLASVENFPTIIFDRCDISTKSVCDYSQAWLKFCATIDDLPLVRSQLCTIKHSLDVNGKNFEKECEQRGLECRESTSGKQLKVYNVHNDNDRNEFTVAIESTLEEDRRIPMK